MRIPIALSLLASLCACGSEEDSAREAASEAAAEAERSAAESGHGAKLDLGTFEIADYRFGMTKYGELTPGREGAIEVRVLRAPNGVTINDLNTYVWVEDGPGNQVSAPTKGAVENGVLHFHVSPRSPAVRAVLRLRAGEMDERASLPLDGHGHEHKQTPHHGVVAAFKAPDGGPTGHLELKLHDDKGDLELWLAEDANVSIPFDLPLDATVRVVFVDFGGREVTLQPRNRERNEDEDGNPNIRDGRTNYFIFPTSPDQDASWLRGAQFQSIVTVLFERDGAQLRSEEFVLTPHAPH